MAKRTKRTPYIPWTVEQYREAIGEVRKENMRLQAQRVALLKAAKAVKKGTTSTPIGNIFLYNVEGEALHALDKAIAQAEGEVLSTPATLVDPARTE